MPTNSSGAAVEAILPLTMTQAGIVAESLTDPTLYVEQQTIEANLALEPVAIVEAWETIVARHQALRSSVWRHSERYYQVVRSPARESVHVRAFDLRSAENPERTARRLAAQELRRGVTPTDQQPVRLVVCRIGTTAFHLVVTHHHYAVDGAAMTILWDELIALAVLPAAGLAPTSSLVDVRRELAAQVPRRTPSLAVPGLRVLDTFPMRAEHALHHTFLEMARLPVIALAESWAVSPASILMASWMWAESRLRDDGYALGCVTRDQRVELRSSCADTAVGMLTETDFLLVPPQQTTGLQELACAVDSGLESSTPLSDALRELWATGVRGVPTTLLTVYTRLERQQGWQLVDSAGRTGFACDVTILVGSTVRVQVTHDVVAAPARIIEQILDVVRSAFAETPGAVETIGLGHIPGGLQHRVHRPELSDEATTNQVVQLARQTLGHREIEADTDFADTGCSSLDLMQFSLELRKLGRPLRIATILSLGSPRAVAEATAAPSPSAGSQKASTSLIERSLLRLAVGMRLGGDALHEQSLLYFGTGLDLARLRTAWLDCLQHYRGLDRSWVEPDSLAPRADGSPPHVVLVPATDSADVARVMREIRDADRARPFAPDGSPVMRFYASSSGDYSAVLLAFHAAVLDGWSFGTLIRDLQAAYSTSPFRPVGADASPLSRPTPAGDAPPLPNLQLPAGAHWPASPVPVIGEPLRAMATLLGIGELISCASSRLGGVTPNELMEAVLVRATADVLDSPDRRVLALRRSIRDASIDVDSELVGQLTVDVPVLVDDRGVASLVPEVRAAYMTAIGLAAAAPDTFAEAVGCGPERCLFTTVVVSERYDQLDEWLVRVADTSAWPEAGSWRRDVPLAHRAITWMWSGADLVIEVVSVLDDGVSAFVAGLADQVAVLAAREGSAGR